MSGPFAGFRERLDIIPAEHHTRPILVGSVAIVVTVVALLAGVTHNLPLITVNGGQEVKMEVAPANQVSHRTVVRVGGVDVGRVTKVEAGSIPDKTSLVTMRIKNDDVKLKRDASAEVRWRTLLGGVMYIDLHPGTASEPLGDATIPASRTSSQTELDQLLQPYDGSTADAQRKLFQALRTSLNNPQGVGHTIETLSPALRTIGQGVEPVRGRIRGDLRRLVTATSKTVAGLADASALRALVHGGNQTLAVTTARRRELGELLELSPGALDSTFITMRRLRTTLGHLDPLVTELRPGARALSPAARAATPALRQLEALLVEARPLLRAAGPTFDALKGASISGIPLMRELEPTLTRLDKELIPYLNEREPETRLLNYQTIGPFFSSLDAAAAEFDREGYRIRLTVPPSNSSSLAMAPIQTSMARACMSVRPNSSEACGKAAQLLSRALFGMPKGAKP